MRIEEAIEAVVEAWQEATGSWSGADWTHEEDPQPAEETDEEGNIVKDPIYCEGGEEDECATCLKAVNDAERAEREGLHARQWAELGEFTQALNHARNAENIEFHWGDSPVWKPFAELLEKIVEEGVIRPFFGTSSTEHIAPNGKPFKFRLRALENNGEPDEDPHSGWTNGRVTMEFEGGAITHGVNIGGGWILDSEEAKKENSCRSVSEFTAGSLKVYGFNEIGDNGEMERFCDLTGYEEQAAYEFLCELSKEHFERHAD